MSKSKMNAPRIAVDCRMVNFSGIGTYIKGIMPLLIGSQPYWRFELYGDPDELSEFHWSSLPNTVVIEFQPPIYSIREQMEWLIHSRHAPDLLWVPHINIPLIWPGKLMVTVHDVLFLAMPELFGRLKTNYAKLFFNHIKTRADAISFVTNFTAQEFSRLVGPPKRNLDIIYNGIDENWFIPETSAIIQPKIDSVPYIVCVGNLKPHKNLPRLIKAFFLLQDLIPHRLLIIGKRDGFLTGDSEVEKMAANHHRIIFTGFVSDAELRAIVSKADALIHPSLYEGFGLPPLEAMATGCPVIISHTGSLPETSGTAATYFNPYIVSSIASVIASVLKDDALRADMIRKGREHAQQFKWQNTTSKIVSLMNRVIT